MMRLFAVIPPRREVA